MRFKNGIFRLNQPVYDTVQLAAVAGQTVTFFAVPRGGALTAALNKGYEHTNLIQAGRLEEGLSLEIEAVSFSIRNEVKAATAAVWADYTLIYNTGHINLLMGQVTFLRLPLTLIPPGPQETNYFSNITPAPAEFKANKGLGSINNVFHMPNTLILEPNESIQVDLYVDGTVSAVTDVQFTLWGVQTRPVR